MATGDAEQRAGNDVSSHGHSGARPLQIIRLGTADEDYSFTFLQENFDSIISKVPKRMKVSVVSVVGAFRTGKSFLLTFLLRYLRFGLDGDEGEEWMSAAGDIQEGNINEKLLPSEATALSFQWRAGKERTTTGIWMWSEPFIRRSSTGEEVAVLVMDTQGMFDNETGMNLTACIFGISTLLSSFQIYNVQNRIQEDNLQHLALFSEYGRLGLRKKAEDAVAAAVDNGEGGSDDQGEELVLPTEEEKPFQMLVFLVRDWPDFDDDAPYHELKRKMDDYLEEVISKGTAEDLRQTREQILSCFEKVRCFVLPHPGLDIPKKTYKGEVEKISPLFRRLLNHFSREIFGPNLECKIIHKRHLTAPELREYLVTYVKLFQSGNQFPEAKTMLEATASANNQNARQLAVSKYRDEMDKFVGPGVTDYRKVDELTAHHEACKEGSLRLFDDIATIGRRSQIKEFRASVLSEIDDLYLRYEDANAQRNPFRNFEYYAIPLIVGFAAFLLRWIADMDMTCSREKRYLCESFSYAMGHLYIFLFTFIAILSFNRIKQFVDYVRQVLPLLIGMDFEGKSKKL